MPEHDDDPEPVSMARRELHRLWWERDAQGVKWVPRDAVDRILTWLAARLRGEA